MITNGLFLSHLIKTKSWWKGSNYLFQIINFIPFFFFTFLSDIGSSINGPTSERILILSPGVHTFPFKLGLPLGLPSTFLGKYGWVQYYCKAILKDPNNVLHKNQQVFIVMNPIDLNLEPPLLTVNMKNDFILLYCCYCCNSYTFLGCQM